MKLIRAWLARTLIAMMRGFRGSLANRSTSFITPASQRPDCCSWGPSICKPARTGARVAVSSGRSLLSVYERRRQQKVPDGRLRQR